MAESPYSQPISLNIVLSLSRLESIIQLKKPFYGNVLMIKASKNKNLVILPNKYSEPFYIPDKLNRNFKYWLRQCVLSKKFDVSQLIEDSYFVFTCKKKDNRLDFYISYNEYLVNGYLIKK